MNDQRFVELVNLYIDREITAAETAELEIEIQNDPRRRGIYHQYCKINHATSLVYDSFRSQAAEVTPISVADGSIAKFQTARKQRNPMWAYASGGLAAAACVAFALVQFNRGQDSVATNTPMVAAAAPVTPAEVPMPASSAPQAQARVEFASLTKYEGVERNYSALLTAMHSDDANEFSPETNRLKTTQSLFQDGVFESKGSAFGHTLRAQSNTSTQTEFTAFQFQR